MNRHTAASPRASFQWTSDPEDPMEIKFKSSSFGPDGSPADTLGHQWSFGGDEDNTLPEAKHRFPEQGTYSVTLAVTTAAGVAATATQNVTTRCAGGTNRPTADISAEHRVLPTGETEWTLTPGIFSTDARGVPWHSSTQLQYQWELNGQTHDDVRFIATADNDPVTPTLKITDTRFGTTTAVQETFAPEEPPPEPNVTVEKIESEDGKEKRFRVAYEPTRGEAYSEIEVYLGGERAVLWRPSPPDIALGSPLVEEVEAKEDEAKVTTRYKSLRGTSGSGSGNSRTRKRKRS